MVPIGRSFDDATVRVSPTTEDVLITAARKFGEGKQFESLWQDLELSDVTLVCHDGSQVMAHKLVLALSSPLLRDILTKSKRHDPILLLHSVDAQELENILKLIYLGEVSLSHAELDSVSVLPNIFNSPFFSPMLSNNNLNQKGKRHQKVVTFSEIKTQIRYKNTCIFR